LLKWACLMPHPPVLIPQVGMGREVDARRTLDGIEKLNLLLPKFNKDVVVSMSPHFPYLPGRLVVGAGERYFGDMSRFGAPNVCGDYNGVPSLASELKEALGDSVTVELESRTRVLDHSTFVPLLLLQRGGRRPGGLIPANPVGLSRQCAYDLGRRLAEVLDQMDGEFGLLCSGDLSHRLSPGAPDGFSTFGRTFDDLVVAALSSGDPRELLALEEERIAEAGQCGLNSVLVLIGASRGPIRVLSYEGPFGVGYAVAVSRPQVHPYVEFVRFVLMDAVRGALPDVSALSRLAGGSREIWDRRSGCFVSLYDSKGDLRGCIGTVEPSSLSLAFEMAKNASAAALEDPRFMPVKLDELPDLKISVDVLSPLEEALVQDLDPKRFGVLVRSGNKRGVLLPDLPGVNSVEEQLAIAKRKAGIDQDEDVQIFRFTVERYKEP